MNIEHDSFVSRWKCTEMDIFEQEDCLRIQEIFKRQIVEVLIAPARLPLFCRQRNFVK